MEIATEHEAGSIEEALGSIVESEESVEELAEPEVTDEDQSEGEEEEQEEESQDDDDPDEQESDDGEEQEQEDDEDEETAVQESRYDVTVDGESRQVTLAELKQGYSGQQYVQKGMAENASTKKEVAEVYAALNHERQQIAQMLDQVNTQGLPQAPVPPSKEMFSNDPIGFMEQKLQYEEDIQTYQAQMHQLQQVKQQQEEVNARQQAEHVRAEALKMAEFIPELKDKTKAPIIHKKLKKTAVDYGYSEQEFASVQDHRAMRLLRDAMKYREILEGKTKADVKSKPARPVMKPGAKVTARKSSKNVKRHARLKNSGSIDDAVALILNS